MTNTIGFHPQTQQFETHTKQDAVGAYIWASMYQARVCMCTRHVY